MVHKIVWFKFKPLDCFLRSIRINQRRIKHSKTSGYSRKCLDKLEWCKKYLRLTFSCICFHILVCWFCFYLYFNCGQIAVILSSRNFRFNLRFVLPPSENKRFSLSQQEFQLSYIVIITKGFICVHNIHTLNCALAFFVYVAVNVMYIFLVI